MSEEEIENYKIGMYTLGEIYNEMTNNMLQRSMTDAIRDKFYDLENQLQQKENIIKEVREYIKEVEKIDNYLDGVPCIRLLEILDKGE